MAIRIRVAKSTIGATVEGIDLAEPIMGSNGRLICDSLDTHGLLVFPGQHSVDDEAQIRLAALWGSPPPSPWEAHSGGGSLFTRISIDASHGPPTGLDCAFHTDMSFTERVPDVAILRPVVIPPGERCGGTTWADSRAALQHLDPALVQELRGRSARHVVGERFARKMALNYGDESGGAVANRFAEGCTHPIVAVHPRTGDELLFVNPRYTRYVIGLADADSDDLLQRLFAAFDRPELQFTHWWHMGDVVVWDEHRTVHRAPDDLGTHDRELRRCTAGWHRPEPVSDLTQRR